MVKIAIEKNWPLMIHANGNRAIDNVITAYRKALNGKSGLIKRHRIEHCSLPTEQAIGDMFELGLSPSFLIGHVGYWGHVFKKTIFEDKALLLDPCQSALRKDMRITFHSDYMVTPLGPLRMMEQAITRVMEQDPNKEVLNKEERLTPAQALKAITYDAAWQCHADTWVGSLEVGKLADYVILAEDPITVKDPSNIRNISVLETWIGGIQHILRNICKPNSSANNSSTAFLIMCLYYLFFFFGKHDFFSVYTVVVVFVVIVFLVCS